MITFKTNHKNKTFFYILLSLSILFLISQLLIIATDTNFAQIGITLALFFAFSLWGHILVYTLTYKKGDFLSGFVWGSVSGIAIASVITSIIIYFIGWNLLVIFCIISAVPAVVILIIMMRGRIIRNPSDNMSYHIIALLGALILVTLFFFLPFKNLGVKVKDTYLYAWLFGHDFIIRMALVDTLSRGLPLKSMFFSGETLSYYWLAYVFPALLHNIKSVDFEIKQILMITELYYSFIAIMALILFLKKYINEKKIFMITMILALCCYSYVWLANIGIKVLLWLSYNFYPIAISNALMNFSGFSHGFYRFFLVEPQGTLAIAVMLMIFTLYEIGASIYKFIIIGLLLGIMFGIDGIIGIIIMLWFGTMGLYYFITHKERRFYIGLKHFIGGTIAVIVYSVFFAINMYSFITGKGALQLSPNWFALKFGVAYFPLAYGPPLILGILGLIVLLRKRAPHDHWVYQYVLLLGISLVFVFFIQNPLEYHFGLLKATRVVTISLLMLSVYFLQAYQKAKLGKVIVLLIALAFPSLITDNIIASDVKNPSTFARSADIEATMWIKSNLPMDAIVQAEPDYPGIDENGIYPKYVYSLIPIFAERITAVGDYKVSIAAQNNTDKGVKLYHQIKRMFTTTDIKECVAILNDTKITHIYIGQLEKSLYPDGIKKFENNNTDFYEIYRYKGITIYQVKGVDHKHY